MQPEPDVLTDHTDIICSTSIERIVNGRDAALVQIEQLIQQLNAISQLTAGIGGGNASDWAMKEGHRYDCWLMEKTEKALPVITRNIDRSLWRDLMLKSGMISLMDAQARTQWYQNLEDGDLPAISEATFSARLSSCIRAKWRCLSGGLSTYSEGCHGITKPTAHVFSARRSSSIIW